MTVLRFSLLPVGSVLTDLGLFNKQSNLLGSALGLFFVVKEVCFYSNLEFRTDA